MDNIYNLLYIYPSIERYIEGESDYGNILLLLAGTAYHLLSRMCSIH